MKSLPVYYSETVEHQNQRENRKSTPKMIKEKTDCLKNEGEFSICCFH